MLDAGDEGQGGRAVYDPSASEHGWSERSRSAERMYAELGPLSETVAPFEHHLNRLRATGLIDANSKLTLEVDGEELRRGELEAFDVKRLDRCVLRVSNRGAHDGPAAVGEWRSMVRRLRARDIDVSVACSNGWLGRSPGSIVEMMFGELHVDHFSVDEAGRESLTRIASVVERFGRRRLSRVTFGRPGAESPHMQHIRGGGEYLGLGPGAATMFVDECRIRRERRRGEIAERESLGPTTHLKEMIMLQLPTDTGFSVLDANNYIEACTKDGRAHSAALGGVHRRLVEMVVGGQLCEVERGRFRPTTDGWNDIDALVTDLWQEIPQRSDTGQP